MKKTTITLVLLWCLWTQASHPSEPPFRPWTPTDEVFASERDCERGIENKIDQLRSSLVEQGLNWPIVVRPEKVIWWYTPGRVRVIEYTCRPRDLEWRRVG